jgi:hypothetical protein
MLYIGSANHSDSMCYMFPPQEAEEQFYLISEEQYWVCRHNMAVGSTQ